MHSLSSLRMLATLSLIALAGQATAQLFYDPVQQPVNTVLNSGDAASRNTLVREKPKLDKLNQYYSETLKNITASGGAYALNVPEKGSLVQSFGFDDYPANTEPFSAANNFRAGSVTKTFLGFAILGLVDCGNLSLSDPWSKYYNSALTPSDIAKNITILHLLNMHSGLKEYTTLPYYTALDLVAQTMGVDPLTSINAAVAAGLSFQPGSSEFADYCNTNYLVLETIFEQAAGYKFQDYLNKSILPRYGLQNTLYPNSTLFAVPQPAPHSFTSFPTADGGLTLLDASEYSSLTASGAGALISNLNDLTKWSCILAKGQGLSKHTADERWRNHILPIEEDPIGLSYGLAGMVFEKTWYGHSGGVPGFTTTMTCDPNTGISFVGIAAQGATGINQETASAMLHIYADKPLPPKPKGPVRAAPLPPHLDCGPPKPVKRPGPI